MDRQRKQFTIQETNEIMHQHHQELLKEIEELKIKNSRLERRIIQMEDLIEVLLNKN
jgi:hypothetical protein